VNQFIDDYIKFASPLTEAPRRFHYYMAYLILSSVVKRNCTYAGSGSFDLSPNLWFIFIGKSSITKKSTMLNIGIRHILESVVVNENERWVLQTDGSKEAFIESLSLNPSGIIVHSEFANFAGWMERQYNLGIMSILMDLYDQPNAYVTKLKKGETTIRNPHLNIATCTTMEYLNENLKESQISGGFLPRFNIVIDNSSPTYIPVTPPPNQELKTKLVWYLEKIKSRVVGPMRYDDKALGMYKEWYLEISKMAEGLPSNVCSSISRRLTDCNKFAMLNSIMRTSDGIGESVMNVSDFDEASKTVEQIIENVREVVSDKITTNDYQVQRNKILEIIGKYSNGNGGMPHSVLLKIMKMDSRRFGDVMFTLEEEDSITVEKKRKDDSLTLSKPTTYYRIKENHENNN